MLLKKKYKLGTRNTYERLCWRSNYVWINFLIRYQISDITKGLIGRAREVVSTYDWKEGFQGDGNVSTIYLTKGLQRYNVQIKKKEDK